MKCIVRKTEESEFYQTENITREAFWNVYQPGCSEHLVLNKLRSGDSYMEELDLVAVLNNVMAGHIISSKAKVIDHLNNEYAVLCVVL